MTTQSHSDADARDDVLELTRHPRLIPILPMIYVAWSDGDLSDDEIREIRGTAAGQDWLGESAKRKLAEWLDPEDPPDAKSLNALLRWLKGHRSAMSVDEKCSLAEYGAALARLELQKDGDGETPASGGSDDLNDVDREWLRDSTHEALQELESALGVAGSDASRELLEDERGGDRDKHPVEEPEAAFDVMKMMKLLDGEGRPVWEQMRQLLQEDAFEYQHDLGVEAYREQVLEWLQRLADEGYGRLPFPEEAGGTGDFQSFMAAFESLAMFDQSLVVKYGVQFGLFGGSIYFLGNERHRETYLPDVASLELPGGFAMTELGHGSNVRDLETTATYDSDNDEIVINTPTETARKEWIGNAAAHGEMVTVFAQLEVDGDQHGVHAFLVRIRDEHGGPRDGVTIEDCGHKMGLNGVDNGRLTFDDVRIPRKQMLDRYGGVDASGEYDSPIPSKTKRFFTMIGTLVGGRVSVAAAGLTAMKSALTIATRYGVQRRQFGPAGEPEMPIIDYRSHQRRLLPRIARAYALNFGVRYVQKRYLERDEDDSREVEALAAGMKAYATELSVDGIQEAREACGGMGYLSENRISELRKDVDIYQTFEGDNTVLMMLVARSLMTKFNNQFQDARFFSTVRYVAEQAAATAQEWNPVLGRNTDSEHLRGRDFQLTAFQHREGDLLRSAATRIKRRIDDGMDAYLAFNDVQDHMLSLARAHIERVVFEQFLGAIDEKTDEGAERDQLEQLRQLFGIDRLFEDIGWFLENGLVEPVKAKAIRTELNALCEEVRPQAVHLVDAFGIPDDVLSAPIAVPDRDI